MVICLQQCADLHMAQLMPLPLTVSCFTKIQIGFTFLVPAHLGSPGQRTVKRVCVCVWSISMLQYKIFTTYNPAVLRGATKFSHSYTEHMQTCHCFQTRPTRSQHQVQKHFPNILTFSLLTEIQSTQTETRNHLNWHVYAICWSVLSHWHILSQQKSQ